MVTSPAGSWDRVRQSFADQFEEDGTSYVYRKSQKGEAIRVSAEERNRFFDEFDRNLRRAKWIIYIGLAVSLGGVVALSMLSHLDLPQPALVAAICAAMIPYFLYFRWAWAAPARELAGRTPVAGERPREEVRRLRLQRMTYGQLASAAAGGLILPFIGSAHQDVLSGWNRLWLVFGGGLVLLSAVQAFRKWRFEQEGSYRNAFAGVPRPAVAEAAVESTSRARRQLWRYLPLAVIVVGGAFIAFTAAGKRLAQTPGFWSVVIVACGGWSLFTVAQGFAKGQIEPFARGFYNTYQRDTQPKRFWASMAWNAIFGCLCLWMAYQMNGQMAARALEGQCFDQRSAHVPSDDLAACNKLIEKRPSSSPYTVANLLVARGIAYQREGEYRRSLEDFSEAIHLEPNYSLAYYDRAITYRELGDKQRATSDFEVAFRLDPKLLKSLQ